MSKNRRYPISEELYEIIFPIIKRLEGLAVILSTLGEDIGQDKHYLWETIYSKYPELRGKPLKIDEINKEIIIVQSPETSIIETLPEGESSER